MEANIFKKRIEEAHSSKEIIKLVFQYPASPRAVIKKGLVVSIAENGFEFEEIYDGLVAYSFEYLVEVKGERDSG